MTEGIEHIALCAENVSTLMAWYQDTFQLELVKTSDQSPCFLRFPDNSLIEFIPSAGDSTPVPEPGDKGFRHLAISVSSIETIVARLERAGVEVVEPLKTFPSGAKMFFFRDIEGNIVQLAQRTNPL